MNLRTLVIRSALTAAGLILAAAPAWSADVVQVGSVPLTQPGQALVIPLTVRDVSGTALDGDDGPARTIQSLALTVQITPAAAFSSASVSRAGATAQATPVFETPFSSGDRQSLIVEFSEANDPLQLGLDGARPGDVVAELALQLTPAFDAGTVQLQLVPATTALGNQQGTLTETQENGHLDLVGGTILVDSSGIFVDGFESGDASSW